MSSTSAQWGQCQWSCNVSFSATPKGVSKNGIPAHTDWRGLRKPNDGGLGWRLFGQNADSGIAGENRGSWLFLLYELQ